MSSPEKLRRFIANKFELHLSNNQCQIIVDYLNTRPASGELVEIVAALGLLIHSARDYLKAWEDVDFGDVDISRTATPEGFLNERIFEAEKCLAALTQPGKEVANKIAKRLPIWMLDTYDKDSLSSMLSAVSYLKQQINNEPQLGKVSVSQDVLEIAKGALQYKIDQREKEGLRATPITLKALEEIDKALQGGEQ